jgi:ribosomal protein S18 acetylase RimI-like enzyme
MSSTIRPVTIDDVRELKRIAVATNMFDDDSVGFFDEMVAGSLDGSKPDHQWLVVVDDGSDVVVAGAYYAPEPFADRLWNLYFIAVDPAHQGGGIGGRLLGFVEDTLRSLGESVARVLIVDTSSTDPYTRTRDFYRRHGFDEEARIREFYGPGDDKVVFWKSLIG